MSRSYKDFQSKDSFDSGKRRKNLRNNAREAQRYLTGKNDDDWDDRDYSSGVFRYRHPGRGASGESSN